LPTTPKRRARTPGECPKGSDDFGDSVASAIDPIPGVVVKKRPRSTQFFVNDQLFAFTTGRSEVIFKMPAQTVRALVDNDIAEKAAMGKRTMKEWVKAPCTRRAASKKHLDLIHQSLDFVRLLADRRKR
jgi:hypothetical protein